MPETVDYIDHVSILVRSIDASLGYYRDQLQLPIVSDERLPDLGVRLVMLDAGRTFLQLVEPTADGPLKNDLDRSGECLHHICFAVKDVDTTIARLSPAQPVKVSVGGRGRRTAFLPSSPNGVRTELTEIEPYQPQSREGVS
ncbi:MAG: methylmalonyl-CoA/ethylmalonyl-CoA epimerase [Thermomicrobiales bacterium]|jgi:methylmalonyl-CoA epimerase|nr:methylmalonyl-CoA/ethylmalonyl-CoA epimerase [Thermomicrobiales bacterium]